MINGGYNRRIRRPGMDMLNPFTLKMNNYTYIIGNPDLKPSYTNNYNLSFILANMYTLALGYTDVEGSVTQVIIRSPDDPDVLLYQHRNVDRESYYYASLSVPVNVYKWWRLSADATFAYQKNKLETQKITDKNYSFRVNNLFTLPNSWSTEINYTHQSGGIQGNWKFSSMNFLNLNLKKGFMKNKLTATVFINNMIYGKKPMMKGDIYEPGDFHKILRVANSWNQRNYGVSVRFNFKTGKDIKVSKVTAGNKEEQER